MEIPEELARRIELFLNSGMVSFKQSELFIEHNWLAVLIGQGVIPERYDPRVDGMQDEEIKRILQQMRAAIRQQAEALPVHAKTLADYCKGELLTRHR